MRKKLKVGPTVFLYSHITPILAVAVDNISSESMAASRTSSSSWTIPTDDFADDEYISDTTHYRIVAGPMVFAARLTTSCPCLIFTAETGNTDMILQQVHYEESCAMEGGLKAVGGARATRDMLRIGCFVSARLLAPSVPGLTTLSFTDRSGFHCEQVGEVPLATHSILLYGLTWYERALPKVAPYNQEFAQQLGELRRILADPVAAPFSAFWDLAFGERTTQRELLRQARINVKVKEAYIAAVAADPEASWNAVFREINRKVGCVVFLHMIDSLKHSKRWPLYFPGETWRVNLADLDASVIIEPLDGPPTGGGSSTRIWRMRKLRDARRAVQSGLDAFQELENRRARNALKMNLSGRRA
jgi:hypothetical protein